VQHIVLVKLAISSIEFIFAETGKFPRTIKAINNAAILGFILYFLFFLLINLGKALTKPITTFQVCGSPKNKSKNLEFRNYRISLDSFSFS